MSETPPMDDNEILLIQRLLALHKERFEKLKLAQSSVSSYEELSKIDDDISEINKTLRELYGY